MKVLIRAIGVYKVTVPNLFRLYTNCTLKYLYSNNGMVRVVLSQGFSPRVKHPQK